MKRHFASAVFGLCLFTPVTAFGQAVYGSIVGTVTDSSSAAIPNAKVTIRDVGKGVSYTTSTNETGNYSQIHLVPGIYEIRVEATGFDTFVQQNVEVRVDSTVQINAQLHPGKVGETINVTAEAALLKTEKADVSDIVSQKAVMELPVFSRDMSRLYFLVPGVRPPATTRPSNHRRNTNRPTCAGQTGEESRSRWM